MRDENYYYHDCGERFIKLDSGLCNKSQTQNTRQTLDHEIVGRVTKVGSAGLCNKSQTQNTRQTLDHEIVGRVTKFKPGDLAAVSCLVDSDGNCRECQAGLEQFCPHMIWVIAPTTTGTR